MEILEIALSPLVTAYALESGTDVLTDTSAGEWGYYVAFAPHYAPRNVRLAGPYSPVQAVRHAIIPPHDEFVSHIVERFPAGTPYAYTL